MKGKRKNKLIAILLVLMMAFSVIPANAFAAETDTPTSRAIADNADVIRLPITIRDANKDNLLFEGNYLNNGDYTTPNMRLNIPETISGGIPQYNLSAIKRIAAGIDTKKEIESLTNSFLITALKKAYGNKTDRTWASSEPLSSTAISNIDYLEQATNAYEAAKWLLNHLFVDGQYYTTLKTDVSNDAENYYTKTYPGYETLVLKKGVYKNKECYYYNSKEADSRFDHSDENEADDEIYNVSEGTGTTPQSGGYFPLDDLMFNESNNGAENLGGNYWNSQKDTHNFHMTTAGSGQFVYHKNEELFFAFTGDDDVFLFINGQLVVNDGGVHEEHASEIYLEETAGSGEYTVKVTDSNGRTWAEYLELEEGKIYDFNFFQMERNTTYSNFSIYTNINVVDSSAVPQKKAYQNGQELIYGSFVTQNSEITYGFELTNNGGANDSPIKNLTFKDDLLGVNLRCQDENGNAVEPVISSNNSANTYANLEYAIYTAGTTPAASAYSKLSEDTQITVNGETKTLNGKALLKALLTNGIEVGKTFSIRGFKYNVGIPAFEQTTKTIHNTVYTSAIGKANNSNADKVINGYANMSVRTWNIINRSFVIDYGKKIKLSNKDIFGSEDDNELNRLTGDGYTVEETINSEKVSTTAKLQDGINAVKLDKDQGLYGTMSESGSILSYELTYTPNKFVNGIDSFIVKIGVSTTTTIEDENHQTTTKTGTNIMNKNVTIIPANNVYYEDDFGVTASNTDSTVGIVYSGSWSTENTKGKGNDSSETSDSIQSSANENYGWDSTYEDDTMFSDGSAHVADGSKQTDGPATATFTFKGTGVDIYSMTNMTTGKVRGTIYKVTNDGEKTTEVAEKILTVDNYAESYPKTEAENDLEGYYQIPTLFFDMGEYATYKVVIQVANGSTTGRSTYYLDGIRVYNPLGTGERGTGESDPINLEPVAKSAYEAANEDNTKVVTLRDVLLDSKNSVTNDVGQIYDPDKTDEVDGAVFIDELPSHTPGEQNNAGMKIAEIGTYKDFGPKNEVYLASGNAIAFTIKGEFAGKVMLGAKSPTGMPGRLTVPEKDDTKNKGTALIETSSAADQYWEIDPVVATDGTRFVVIQNTGKVMMSLTKLRIQQLSKRTNAVLEVTQDTLKNAASFNSNAGTANAVNNNYSAPATIKEGTVTINNPAPVENEVVNESSWGEISASVETYLTKSN